MHVETKRQYQVKVPAQTSIGAVTAFEGRLEQAINRKPDEIQLDCADLVQVTSAHINALWQAHQICATKGVELRLVSASPGLIRILKALDLYEFFPDSGKTQKIVIERARTERPVDVARYLDEFQSDGVHVREAVERFARYLSRIGVPDLTVFELKTVFYEVAMNIGVNAELDAREEIGVTAESSTDRLRLTFRDGGKAFDPTEHMTKMDFRVAAQRRQRRGFGIAMVARLTDKVTYVREDGRCNVLTLEKQW